MAEYLATQGAVRKSAPAPVSVQTSTKVALGQPSTAAVDHAIKRTAHGSSAWVVPQHLKSCWQPQDGAAHATTAFDSEPAPTPATDSSRSLARRLMGLNIPATHEAVEPMRKPSASAIHLVKQQVA